MSASQETVGFIGLGKLGLPFATNLLESGYHVVGCRRGRSEELVEAGGEVPGDGSPREVAERAEVIFVCVPDDAALSDVIEGQDGVLAAERPTIVIQMSTVAIALMERLQQRLAEHGGQLLDCQVSGTPPMAKAKQAVIFASGERGGYEAVAEVIKAIAPVHVFVGELGAGTNFKHVANLLAFVHVTVAAEAMAFAARAGLDLGLVAGVISKAAGATSGQFNIRAPLMAEGKFENPMVTVDQMREVCEHICARAEEIGAATPLVSVVRELYDEFAAKGEGESDPGKLFLHLQEQVAAKA